MVGARILGLVRRGLATAAVKADLSLVSKLRKETQCSISKAKDALIASANDYKAALIWLEEDAIKHGQSKANKLSGRVASDGLVGIVVADANRARPYPLASIVELNSETDFVARNQLFSQLVFRVGLTAAKIYKSIPSNRQPNMLNSLPIEILKEASLLTAHAFDALDANMNDQLQKSTNNAITELVGKLGENLSLRRATVLTPSETNDDDSTIIAGGYAHGNVSGESHLEIDHAAGRIAALVILKASPKEAAATLISSGALPRTARQLAQHVVGFNPKSISSDTSAPKSSEVEESEALLEQCFLPSGGSQTVQQALDILAASSGVNGARISVEAFTRFERGEGIEKADTPSFAEEVERQQKFDPPTSLLG
ncbi:elongation factor TS-domain-containing protein [Cladochytrium replicatum]|nr:elongation factor TS-domain-containing protein [Cladochytrium replicatum]